MIPGFGDRLLMLLEMKGLSRSEFATATGLTEAAISRYINDDREPKALAVAKMAQVLGVSADLLLGVETQTPELEEALLLVARNANDITPDQKKSLINALVK